MANCFGTKFRIRYLSLLLLFQALFVSSFEKKPSLENIEEVKVERKISQIEIKVNDEKALLPLRTVLLQKISENNDDAKIILIANRDNQEVKIALASNFKIAEIDIFRLKNLHKDLIIKSII